jgi:hypothetical protein
MDEFEKKQVLLVEDNARLRGTVREILRWQGYRLLEAADGAQALALAAAAQPDVIVTDLNMPVMDGAAFIQRCRAMPGLDQVPIIRYVRGRAGLPGRPDWGASECLPAENRSTSWISRRRSKVGRAHERWPF